MGIRVGVRFEGIKRAVDGLLDVRPSLKKEVVVSSHRLGCANGDRVGMGFEGVDTVESLVDRFLERE
jgi:hypothetical protein